VAGLSSAERSDRSSPRSRPVGEGKSLLLHRRGVYVVSHLQAKMSQSRLKRLLGRGVDLRGPRGPNGMTRALETASTRIEGRPTGPLVADRGHELLLPLPQLVSFRRSSGRELRRNEPRGYRTESPGAPPWQFGHLR
jgi:hypothetical protein